MKGHFFATFLPFLIKYFIEEERTESDISDFAAVTFLNFDLFTFDDDEKVSQVREFFTSFAASRKGEIFLSFSKLSPRVESSAMKSLFVVHHLDNETKYAIEQDVAAERNIWIILDEFGHEIYPRFDSNVYTVVDSTRDKELILEEVYSIDPQSKSVIRRPIMAFSDDGEWTGRVVNGAIDNKWKRRSDLEGLRIPLRVTNISPHSMIKGNDDNEHDGFLWEYLKYGGLNIVIRDIHLN